MLLYTETRRSYTSTNILHALFIDHVTVSREHTTLVMTHDQNKTSRIIKIRGYILSFQLHLRQGYFGTTWCKNALEYPCTREMPLRPSSFNKSVRTSRRMFDVCLGTPGAKGANY